MQPEGYKCECTIGSDITRELTRSELFRVILSRIIFGVQLFTSGSEVVIDVWFGYARTYIYAPKRTRPCNVFFMREGGDHISKMKLMRRG